MPIKRMQGVRTPNWRRPGFAKIVAMPARRPTPTLRLRRLASELRRLRAEAGLTREDVAERTGVNEATLYRIETAKARPQARTLASLLDLYAVPDEARAELAALARQSGAESWLQSFPNELPEPLWRGGCQGCDRPGRRHLVALLVLGTRALIVARLGLLLGKL